MTPSTVGSSSTASSDVTSAPVSAATTSAFAASGSTTWLRVRPGWATALLTRVGGDHMGRFIREQLVREGVDVTSVLTDETRLTALVVLGIRDRETFPLIFYREDCADMALCAADVDEAQVRAARAVLI